MGWPGGAVVPVGLSHGPGTGVGEPRVGIPRGFSYTYTFTYTYDQGYWRHRRGSGMATGHMPCVPH